MEDENKQLLQVLSMIMINNDVVLQAKKTYDYKNNKIINKYFIVIKCNDNYYNKFIEINKKSFNLLKKHYTITGLRVENC